jgi:hypothetical protein
VFEDFGTLDTFFRQRPKLTKEALLKFSHMFIVIDGMLNFMFINPQVILKWADAAMYQAKEARRNSFRFYDLLISVQ